MRSSGEVARAGADAFNGADVEARGSLDGEGAQNPSAGRPQRALRVSDVRGILRLLSQGTAGMTRVVEAVHRSVWGALGIPGGSRPGRTRGITGLVYAAVHEIALLTGWALDAGLSRLQPLLEDVGREPPDSVRREALLAVLNGVMGDHLLASDSPLAVPMTLRYRGEALDWRCGPRLPGATRKVLVLIHGLCGSDLRRSAELHGRSTDHGEALAEALGYTPVYLRYNSGLHTSENARWLASLLERLAERWPTPIEEISVVAYSMGGLVIRGAVHQARSDALSWPDHLKRIVFLGTPHHGAPLERVGHWLDRLLGSTPFTAPLGRLGQVRSRGITDLRHGHVLEEDWRDRPRFQNGSDGRRPLPLPAGVRCFAVAASLAAEPAGIADRLLGDGLVPVDSALGLHADPRRRLGFPTESRRVVRGTKHLELLSSSAVAEQLVRWLTPARGTSRAAD